MDLGTVILPFPSRKNYSLFSNNFIPRARELKDFSSFPSQLVERILSEHRARLNICIVPDLPDLLIHLFPNQGLKIANEFILERSYDGIFFLKVYSKKKKNLFTLKIKTIHTN